MLEIKNTPSSIGKNHFTLTGDILGELLLEMMPRIRPESRAFYRQCIKEDLEKKGKSRIDAHAGMGYFYTIVLEKRER